MQDYACCDKIELSKKLAKSAVACAFVLENEALDPS